MLLMILRNDENMVRTDSQDYGVDEILHTAISVLLAKISQLISETKYAKL